MRYSAFCLALMAALVLAGCAPRAVDDPPMLAEACSMAESAFPLWCPGVRGLQATVKPLGPRMNGSSLLFQAVYKSKGADGAGFAMLMPQGGKIGQWERVRGRETVSALPVPEAKTMLRMLARFLDELYHLRAEPEDQWDLRPGDEPGTIGGRNIVLRRRAARGGKRYLILMDQASGRILSVVKYADDTQRKPPLEWKLTVSEDARQCTFTDYTADVSLEIRINQFSE